MTAFFPPFFVAASLVAALVLQDFLPPVALLEGARTQLVPIVFCYGALAFPFAGMLGLAVAAGFLSDLSMLHLVDGRVEIPLGWSILFYVLSGAVLQGFQPLFLRGRWEIHSFGSGICTVLLLLSQYVMISFRRESLHLDAAVGWHILGPGMLAVLFAPFFYLFMRLVTPPRPVPRPRRFTP